MEERADVEELTAEDYSQAGIPSMEEKADIPSHDIPNIPDTEMDEITTLYDHVDDMELNTMVGKPDKIIDDMREYVEHNFVGTGENDDLFHTLTHFLSHTVCPTVARRSFFSGVVGLRSLVLRSR